ncbi:MAG: hypothetical protein ACOH2V_01170 [Candidatus Saccharimonadaceae bacterium]
MPTTTGLAPQEYAAFKYKVGVAYSLKNFLESIAEKEYSIEEIINSETEEKTEIKIEGNFSMARIITQTLINSVGTTYATDLVQKQGRIYKEMHSHNSERVQLQEGMYTHLKNGATNQEKYYLTTKELKQALANETNGVRSLTAKLLGIRLSNDSTQDLITKWTVGVVATEAEGLIPAVTLAEARLAKLVGVFRGISEVIFPNYNKKDNLNESLFSKILTNEQNLDAANFDEVNENTEIIKPLSAVKSVQDILDAKMSTMIVRILTTISKLQGEPIPTSIIPSLGQNDLTVLRERIRIENAEGHTGTYKNYFTKEGNLWGTIIKLETVRDKDTKDADRLNVIENTISHFEYDFLDSFKSDYDSVNLMIGNYSDKARIIGKRVNKAAQFNEKYIIGKNELEVGVVLNADEV